VADGRAAVTIFLRQTICLTSIFASTKVNPPNLAGDSLWRSFELDAPDGLVERRFWPTWAKIASAVGWYNNRLGKGPMLGPSSPR
jgi:hypothetical protein